ncbi:MAG: translation initiation factor IF-2 [bacterium]|nr:translation initiation factor IF-2 [bacterium]
MNILEYCEDVGKTEEEILKLCDKLGISYESVETVLSDDDITLLDNELASIDDAIDSEDKYDYELDEKVEQMIIDKNIDIDSHQHKEKVKNKSDRIESNKNSFHSKRKEMYKHREKLQSNEDKNDNVIVYKNNMTVTELSNLLEVNVLDLIKKLMKLGIMANVNYSLSYDIAELLVIDYNKVLKTEENVDISNFEKYDLIEDDKDLVVRPPVVTIMGHVDHGKTSLLDAIRQTDVVSGEAGGITQAIGAYQVELNGKKITFIDTPGHEAFTEMRARGASVTDIVVIIVAANDGVMPQTKEAIDHAKAAKVPIIVAINKIDLPDANVDKVLTELAENGLTPEKWGGDVLVNEISAKTKVGIDELLENILLVSEMNELKANPNRYATGTVIEARLDKQVGTVVSLLVQNGTLRLGDPMVVGNSYGKVRTLRNDKGMDIVEALPSMPVEVTGLNETPKAGDKFMAFET